MPHAGETSRAGRRARSPSFTLPASHCAARRVLAAQGKGAGDLVSGSPLPLLFLRGTADPLSPDLGWERLRKRLTSASVEVGAAVRRREPGLRGDCGGSFPAHRAAAWRRRGRRARAGAAPWVHATGAAPPPPQVTEVAGGDHSLRVKDSDAAAEAALDKKLSAAVEAFVKRQVQAQ